MNIADYKQYLKEYRGYFFKFPQPLRVYYHWTAGKYYTTFNDYHQCIDGDGDIIESLPLCETPQATWHRNTGSIAIAICACYNAKPYNLGEYPPLPIQIETLAKMTAAISDIFGYPITEEVFMTHGEAANIDGYGLYSDDPDCRWDLEQLQNCDEIGTGGDIIRNKALWYQEQWR